MKLARLTEARLKIKVTFRIDTIKLRLKESRPLSRTSGWILDLWGTGAEGTGPVQDVLSIADPRNSVEL